MQYKVNYMFDVDICPRDAMSGPGTYNEGTCFCLRATHFPSGLFGKLICFCCFAPASLPSGYTFALRLRVFPRAKALGQTLRLLANE